MRSRPVPPESNPLETPSPTETPSYRRLRDKVDAHVEARQMEDAAETLRTIQRLQYLSQIK